MRGRIPDSIVEEILARVDIAELIAGYIPLKRAGRNFKALCPFHHEKTPSFMVSADKQIYHCFGCGAGGNAISFLMQHERLEFPEAVEMLAKKAGVALPEAARQDERAASLVTQLYKIHEVACLFYENALQSQEATVVAKNYLLKRGLTPETIKLFRLGYAFDKWDSLLSHLRLKGVPLAQIEKAGLINVKSSGGYYDRFRHRIIFPIFDIKSRVIAFGARRIAAEDNPKYVNSPETQIYTKGKNLYGLNFSKDAIRQEDCAVIVEGYLDFIIPYQAGLKNLVASSGTAFTPEQVRLLKRYTKNAVLVYDPDEAGQLATLRALDLFVEEGMNVKVAVLPKGLDPDLFVREKGIEEFKRLIASSQDLLEYKLAVLKSRFDVGKIDGKTAIAAEILPTIDKIEDSIAKGEYRKRLSEMLGTDEYFVLEELNKRKSSFPARRTAPEAPLAATQRAVNHPAERLLMKLMLEEGSLIGRVRELLEPADFQDERIAKLVSLMFDMAAQGQETGLQSLVSRCRDESISQLICESALLPEVSAQDRERVAHDCIRRLKEEKTRIRRQHLYEEIKMAQSMGDEKRLYDLMREFHKLTRVR